MATENKTTKRVFNLMIVDESGSMSIIHNETLAGINETITTCQKMQEAYPEMEQRLTLITFDSNHFKMHYDNIAVKKASPLTNKQYNPCAATPLYDAIGKGIAKMNAQTEADDNVLVTIITDGEENCSKEYNLKMVKTLIEKLKKQGWTFTLIGTDNLDVEGMAGSLSIDNHLEFAEDPLSTLEMFEKEQKCRNRLMVSLHKSCPMPEGSYFDDEE